MSGSELHEAEVAGVEQSQDKQVLLNNLDTQYSSAALSKDNNSKGNAELAKTFSAVVALAEKRGVKKQVEDDLLHMARGPHFDATVGLLSKQAGKQFDTFVSLLNASREPSISEEERASRKNAMMEANLKLAQDLDPVANKKTYESISQVVQAENPPQEAIMHAKDELEEARKTAVRGKLVTYRALSRALQSENDQEKKSKILQEHAALFGELSEMGADDQERFQIEDALLKMAKDPNGEVEEAKEKIIDLLEESPVSDSEDQEKSPDA